MHLAGPDYVAHSPGVHSPLSTAQNRRTSLVVQTCPAVPIRLSPVVEVGARDSIQAGRYRFREGTIACFDSVFTTRLATSRRRSSIVFGSGVSLVPLQIIWPWSPGISTSIS